MKLKIKIFELKVKSSYLGKQNFKKNSKNFFTGKNFVEKCRVGLNQRGKIRVQLNKRYCNNTVASIQPECWWLKGCN